MDEELIYWIWLQQRLGFASRFMDAVLEQPGRARFIYERTRDDLISLDIFPRSQTERLCDKELTDAEETLASCEKLGYDIITPDDRRYPRRLLCIAGQPAALYVRGELPDVDNEVGVAIVGTRQASQYGIATAQELARHLTEAGALIISGAAAGIDTAAHQGALMAKGGRTVAVLGCGIDHRYNSEGKALRSIIAENGAIVSEYPPGFEPYAANFPLRNRLISGMSLGVAVIEAGRRSGSLITAHLALEQGKDIFAVPGYVGDIRSQGVNQLLRDGAKELLSPADVLREYAPLYPHKLTLGGHDRPLMEGRTPLDDALGAAAARSGGLTSDDFSAALGSDTGSPADVPKKRGTAKKPKPPATGASGGQAKPSANGDPPQSADSNAPARPELPGRLSVEAKALHELLEQQPKHVDELAAASGLSVRDTLRALTELELFSLTQPHPGRRYSL